jgi:hypothetical protein
MLNLVSHGVVYAPVCCLVCKPDILYISTIQSE